MRTAPVVLAIALVAAAVPPADASDPMRILMDWEDGHFHAGLVAAGVGAVDDGEPVPPSGVGPVNLQRFVVDVDQCHRRVELDLLYEPANVTAEAGDAASAAVQFEFQIEVFDPDGQKLGSRRIAAPGMGYAFGTMPSGGQHRFDLYLMTGADVDWSIRVRGFEVPGETACDEHVVVNEVEANPAGADAGNEWLELYNPGVLPVNVSGWTLRSTHGQVEALVLADGSTVPAGGYLVVVLAEGQFLDNEDESVVLEDAAGVQRDRTPTLTDAANDGRTWQLSPDGGPDWTFTDGTGGGPNP